MKLIRLLLLALVLVSGSAVDPAVTFAQQPPVEQQDEFVPAETLPQREQVPAAPLLIAAYAFVLVALFAYVWSLSRRMSAVKTDISRLEGEIKRGSRA